MSRSWTLVVAAAALLTLGACAPPAPQSPPQEAYAAVWAVEVLHGHGTGFAVAQVGDRVWLATARHVADEPENPVTRARQPFRDLYDPRVEWVDQAHDLALVSFHTDRQEPLLHLNGGPPPRLGEPVWSVGYPLQAGLRISYGLWSGGNRMTAPIHFGNSGGPVLDARGVVVGVLVSVWTAPTMMGDRVASEHCGEVEPVFDLAYRLALLAAPVRVPR
jgi:S1-C subfamily serine protease